MSVRRLALLLLSALALAGAQGMPPVPYRDAPDPPAVTAGDLRSCRAGETTYLLDASGRVRGLAYARLIPDNTLRVRQSYDRAGTLTGMAVQWTGFAGRRLDVRGAFDARGRLVRETGYRAKGMTTPLRAYLRPVPRRAPC